MRGVLGPLLMAAGIWLLYGVFTGRLLGSSSSATQTSTSSPSSPSSPPSGSSQTSTPHPILPGGPGPTGPTGATGSGPDGFSASQGMSAQPGGFSLGTPGGLPTMRSMYGAARGVYV